MFSQEETQSLLAEKGIGKTVLQRLQQMGLDDVAKLAAADVGDMSTRVARCDRKEVDGKDTQRQVKELDLPDEQEVDRVILAVERDGKDDGHHRGRGTH